MLSYRIGMKTPSGDFHPMLANPQKHQPYAQPPRLQKGVPKARGQTKHAFEIFTSCTHWARDRQRAFIGWPQHGQPTSSYFGSCHARLCTTIATDHELMACRNLKHALLADLSSVALQCVACCQGHKAQPSTAPTLMALPRMTIWFGKPMLP
jgi:hypothetical protein